MKTEEAVSDAVYQMAERYAALGVSVIPIQLGTKEPPTGFRWGEYARRLASADERYDWFMARGYQLAVVAGPVSGNLVPLDFDSAEGFPSLAERYPRLWRFPRVRTGSGKVHVWLRTKTPTKKYVCRAPDGGTLEVRAGTHYTVVPPSLHPTGRPYRWEVEPWDGIPVIDLEEIGLQRVTPRAGEPGDPVDEGAPLSERERSHMLKLLEPHYVPYARHELCLALAGWLASHGVPEADTRSIVRELAEQHGDGDRVREFERGVRDSYARTRQGFAVAGWSRLVDLRDPLISPATAKSLDLLLRARDPLFSFERAGEQAREEPRFRLIPVAEMRDRTPPPQLVRGVLVEESFAAIVGDSGSYKTFLALDLALHIAGGLEWFGRAVEPGFAIYIAGEGSAGMGARIRAWELAHETTARDCWFLTGAPQFTDPRDVDDFLRAAAGLRQQPKLVLVDTLARVAVGLEENNSKDMGLLIAGAERIQRELSCCVALIHHMNRQGAYRGHSSLRAAFDSMLEMRREPETKSLVTLSADKQKDLDLFAPLKLVPRAVQLTPGDGILPGLSSVVLEEAETGDEPRVTDDKVLDALHRLGWACIEDLALALEISVRRLRPYLNDMLTRRRIHRKEVRQSNGRGKRLVYGPPEAADDDPDF